MGEIEKTQAEKNAAAAELLKTCVEARRAVPENLLEVESVLDQKEKLFDEQIKFLRDNLDQYEQALQVLKDAFAKLKAEQSTNLMSANDEGGVQLKFQSELSYLEGDRNRLEYVVFAMTSTLNRLDDESKKDSTEVGTKLISLMHQLTTLLEESLQGESLEQVAGLLNQIEGVQAYLLTELARTNGGRDDLGSDADEKGAMAGEARKVKKKARKLSFSEREEIAEEKLVAAANRTPTKRFSRKVGRWFERSGVLLLSLVNEQSKKARQEAKSVSIFLRDSLEVIKTEYSLRNTMEDFAAGGLKELNNMSYQRDVLTLALFLEEVGLIEGFNEQALKKDKNKDLVKNAVSKLVTVYNDLDSEDEKNFVAYMKRQANYFAHVLGGKAINPSAKNERDDVGDGEKQNEVVSAVEADSVENDVAQPETVIKAIEEPADLVEDDEAGL